MRTGVQALAGSLIDDASLRDKFSAEPDAVLEQFEVARSDLPALAALVEVGSRGHPKADRRACQALVFLALASVHE